MLERILVPLDGFSLTKDVLSHSIALARAFNGHVTLLHVLEPDNRAYDAVDPLSWALRKVEMESNLKEVTGHLQKCGVSVDYVLLEGPAAVRIIEYAHHDESDLIILSSHQQDIMSGWSISNVAQKVVQRAHTSTMIVRAGQYSDSSPFATPYRRILVPLDGSWRAESGLPWAQNLACCYNAKLILAHVVMQPYLFHRSLPTAKDTRLVNQLVEQNLAEARAYLKRLQSRMPVKSETHVMVSNNVENAFRELVERHQIDLVLLSAHGHSSNTQRPYGSQALNFILYGNTPLLIKQDLLPHQIELTQAELAAKDLGSAASADRFIRRPGFLDMSFRPPL
ncbi:MAG TPA: universal stress protein [Anaerolineae bacterium]